MNESGVSIATRVSMVPRERTRLAKVHDTGTVLRRVFPLVDYTNPWLKHARR